MTFFKFKQYANPSCVAVYSLKYLVLANFPFMCQNFLSHPSLIHSEASLDLAEKLHQRKQTGSDKMINKGTVKHVD